MSGEAINQRLLSKEQAAQYCGLSTSGFGNWVSEGRVPPAIPATHRWDRKAIDEALDRLSGIKTNDGLSELEQWRLKKANARAS